MSKSASKSSGVCLGLSGRDHSGGTQSHWGDAVEILVGILVSSTLLWQNTWARASYQEIGILAHGFRGFIRDCLLLLRSVDITKLNIMLEGHGREERLILQELNSKERTKLCLSIMSPNCKFLNGSIHWCEYSIHSLIFSQRSYL